MGRRFSGSGLMRRPARSFVGAAGEPAAPVSPLIVPIIAAQDTAQTTASLTYVDCACETAALTLGVKYWVVARGSCGGDTTSRHAHLQLLHGATQIAEAGGESSLTAAQAYSSSQLMLSTCVTGTGATLKFQLKASAGTSRAGAMFICAVPLTTLTEGVDYHEISTTASTEVVSNAATGSYTDVLVSTTDNGGAGWDFGASQSWLLFGSYEIDADAFTAGRSYSSRMLIGGVALNLPQRKEGENIADVYNSFFATKETLAGVVEIKLQVQSVGTAEVDARRPNLFALRAGVLNQVVQAEYAGAFLGFTSATYVDLGQLNASITPVVSGAHCLVLYAGNSSSTAASALTQIYNSTASTAHCIDAGEGVNSTADKVPWLAAHCVALSAPTSFKAQVRSSGGTTVRWPAANTERIQVMILELSKA